MRKISLFPKHKMLFIFLGIATFTSNWGMASDPLVLLKCKLENPSLAEIKNKPEEIEILFHSMSPGSVAVIAKYPPDWKSQRVNVDIQTYRERSITVPVASENIATDHLALIYRNSQWTLVENSKSDIRIAPALCSKP